MKRRKFWEVRLLDKSLSWPLRWPRMVTGILLELKRVKKLIKYLINKKFLIELLMETTRRVSSSCSLMARDSKKVALFMEKTNYLETAIRSMFLPDSVVSRATIK